MLAFLMLAAAIPASGAPLKMADPAKPCEWGLKHAGRDPSPARARKLGEMPPANQVLTVYRAVEGCPKPVVVRRDIGAR